MSNTKHTPGPWQVTPFFVPDYMKRVFPETDGSDYMTRIRVENGRLIGACYGYISKKKEAEANAKLIAAAPELLEALQASQELIQLKHGHESGEWFDLHQKVVSAIKKAIE